MRKRLQTSRKRKRRIAMPSRMFAARPILPVEARTEYPGPSPIDTGNGYFRRIEYSHLRVHLKLELR